MRVDPSRIALPTKAGGVDPLSYLPSHMHDEFRNIEDRAIEPNLWDEPLPRPCHRVDKCDELQFLLRLRACGMRDFVNESEFYVQDRRGPWILPIGGFFAVARKEDCDRLIYDRRPANSTMRPFRSRARLPHGCCSAKLIIDAHQTVRVSLDDLRCFFYCLSQPPQGHLLDGVGRQWLGRQINLPNLKRHGSYRFAFSVKGMGGLSAVDIAQHTHESILRRNACLLPQHHVHFDENVPCSSTWEGVYVDDKCITQILPRSAIFNASDYFDATLVRRGEAAYDSTRGLTKQIC